MDNSRHHRVSLHKTPPFRAALDVHLAPAIGPEAATTQVMNGQLPQEYDMSIPKRSRGLGRVGSHTLCGRIAARSRRLNLTPGKMRGTVAWGGS
ncbi:MAG: hypothetical protein LC775_06510, partial [Acidobacteria bacterium]|nr:hypothetical protein [Acidobacteriota bacterium]